MTVFSFYTTDYNFPPQLPISFEKVHSYFLTNLHCLKIFKQPCKAILTGPKNWMV